MGILLINLLHTNKPQSCWPRSLKHCSFNLSSVKLAASTTVKVSACHHVLDSKTLLCFCIECLHNDRFFSITFTLLITSYIRKMSEPLTSFVLCDSDWIQILPTVRVAQSTPLRKPNFYLFSKYLQFFFLFTFLKMFAKWFTVTHRNCIQYLLVLFSQVKSHWSHL